MKKLLTTDSVEVINVKLDYMRGEIAEIKKALQEGYVKKEEFEPVKKVVYGLVSLILVTVVTAIIYLVIQRQ